MFIWRIRTQIAQKLGPNHSNNDLEEQMSKQFDLVFKHLQQDGVFAYSIWLKFYRSSENPNSCLNFEY